MTRTESEALIAQVLELAAKATAGEREIFAGPDYGQSHIPLAHGRIVIEGDGQPGLHNDIAFIAFCDPVNIVALATALRAAVDREEAAEAKVRELAAMLADKLSAANALVVDAVFQDRPRRPRRARQQEGETK